MTPDPKPLPPAEVGRLLDSAPALLDELARLRRESVTLVAGLGPVDLERDGRHPKVGLLRVSDLLHEWVHHDRNHLKQILSNVQAYTWPHMGNAQKFSEP
jgi:DinB superfamily